MAGIYGTSMPKTSFFGSLSQRGTPDSPLISVKRGSYNLNSPKSYRTARSSLASYNTAPSGSVSIWQRNAVRTGMSHKIAQKTHQVDVFEDITCAFQRLVRRIVAQALLFAKPTGKVRFTQQEETRLRNLVGEALLSIHYTEISREAELIEKVMMKLLDYEVEGRRLFLPLSFVDKTALRSVMTSDINVYTAINKSLGRTSAPGEVFSSEWLKFLNERGILVDPQDELNWSGEGQHVEYRPEDESRIPLRFEKILGHSQTAIIDSVRCRRIRLARKKITCNRQISKEEAIIEVEHLTKLQHSHIVRVVGTYIFKKDLAILLYPATECDLDAYMDEIITVNRTGAPLSRFLGCLSKALHFIHQNNVKHMDIKPKNILVRVRPRGVKVYVADFGIARSYTSAAESETDSPIPFTRAYAAPEVVLQDKRGFSADIFSLGCVFTEILATMYSCVCGQGDERQKLLDLRKANSGTSAFYTNIGVVAQWFAELYGIDGRARIKLRGSALERLLDLFPSMLSLNPGIRPKAQELQVATALLRCSSCEDGPDAFEAADPV